MLIMLSLEKLRLLVNGVKIILRLFSYLGVFIDSEVAARVPVLSYHGVGQAAKICRRSSRSNCSSASISSRSIRSSYARR